MTQVEFHFFLDVLLSDKVQAKRGDRFEAMKARIFAAGYTLSDIEKITIDNLPGARSMKELTDKEWDRIKDKVLAGVEAKIQLRQGMDGWFAYINAVREAALAGRETPTPPTTPFRHC
ncbi:hypothetical protein BC834DRAFT_967230 [Gloeopeniophorella convolvens]|nr:hypothetical protein BC834DRAFT_967230 [Gloeopeniophorella convolvens]